jgi:hypothetical protein
MWKPDKLESEQNKIPNRLNKRISGIVNGHNWIKGKVLWCNLVKKGIMWQK